MTQIFDSFSAFINRIDKTVNGVDADFVYANPDWEETNETNKGCWRC